MWHCNLAANRLQCIANDTPVVLQSAFLRAAITVESIISDSGVCCPSAGLPPSRVTRDAANALVLACNDWNGRTYCQ
jgi:hypothetical protein